jgi:hypothetical protein
MHKSGAEQYITLYNNFRKYLPRCVSLLYDATAVVIQNGVSLKAMWHNREPRNTQKGAWKHNPK